MDGNGKEKNITEITQESESRSRERERVMQ